MQVGALWHDKHMLTVSLSGAINFLDVDHPNKPKRVLHGVKNNIADLAVDPKGGRFYTCDIEGQVSEWEFKEAQAVWLTGKGHGKGISGIAVNADHTKVITVGLDDKIRLNNIADHAFSNDAASLDGMPVALATGNKDPHLAAVPLAQNKLIIVRDGKVATTTELAFEPLCAAFSPDDTQLAVAGKDKVVHLYSISGDAPKETKKLSGSHDRDITSLEYSPDGKLLCSTGKDRAIYLWSTATGEVQNPTGWTFHSANVPHASWSPDVKLLATGSTDEDINIWRDFKNFKFDRQTIKLAHKGGVLKLYFWDASTLLSVGSDRAIRIWKL